MMNITIDDALRIIAAVVVVFGGGYVFLHLVVWILDKRTERRMRHVTASRSLSRKSC